MSNPAYKKGLRREYQSRALLEAAGYRVFRMAGSHGEFDLIGIGRHDIVLCQVKANRNAGPLERLALADFPAPRNVRRLIHKWVDYRREPEVIAL